VRPNPPDPAALAACVTAGLAVMAAVSLVVAAAICRWLASRGR
jgi:hypothetical protein